MQQNDELIYELESAKDKAQLDECVKRIISQKNVLARILKETAYEFAKYTLGEIEAMIEPDVKISHTPIRPIYKLVPSPDNRILGDNTEEKIPGEGQNFYDIRFHIYLPEKQKTIPIKLLINIEAQSKFYKKYHFVTRGIFYGARMISSQLGTEFCNSRYDKLKKVYSIWICSNAPKKIGNSMAEFSIQKRNIIGRVYDGKKHYDKLSVIVICLNENAPQKESGLHHFLNILLSERLSFEDKKDLLEKYFDITLSTKSRKDVNNMCNFGEAIEERALRKGIRKGIRKGRQQGKREGNREGKRELNLLVQYLVRDNRMDDLIKSTTDIAFQDSLFAEYGFEPN